MISCIYIEVCELQSDNALFFFFFLTGRCDGSHNIYSSTDWWTIVYITPPMLIHCLYLHARPRLYGLHTYRHMQSADKSVV